MLVLGLDGGGTRSFSNAVDNVDREDGAVGSDETFVGNNRESGPGEEALEPGVEDGLLALKADALEGLIGDLVSLAVLDVVGLA